MLTTPVWHTSFQPFRERIQSQVSTQAIISFLDSLILPQFEFIPFESPALDSGKVALVVFLVDAQRIPSVVVFQFLQVRFLRRKLLAGTVFSVRDTVTVGPVVVALDDEIFPAASALLKLQSSL